MFKSLSEEGRSNLFQIFLALVVLICIYIIYNIASVSTQNINRYNNEYNSKFNPEVKVGQTWLRIDTLDPFQPKRIDTVKILDIKNDYVLISISNDTTSRLLGIFKYKSYYTLLK